MSILSTITFHTFWPLLEVASAQTPPQLPCGNLPGCGGGGVGGNILVDTVFPALATMTIRIAAAGAMLFIIGAGYQMFFSQGDEGAIGKAKWAIFYSLFGLALVIVSQILVSAVVSETSLLQITDELSLFRTIRTLALGVLDGVFIIIIIWASMRMLMAQGKPDDFKKATTMITWAIVGAVVIHVSNALVQMLAAFFGV